MFYYKHRVVFDEKMIYVTSWTGRSDEMSWEEIEDVTFSQVLGYLRLFSGNKKLNIQIHLVGFVELLRLMEDKTKFRAADLKLPLG